MKLHLACGDVYLKGYENIDIDGKLVSEVSKKELEANSTTLDNYFKYKFGAPRRDIITDVKMDLLKSWNYADKSIDEIVMISCIEHFTLDEAGKIIQEIKRVLKPGGKLLIDFPDIWKSILKYYGKDPEFCIKLIYCNHKNEYSAHKWGYTKDTFRELIGGGKDWDKVIFRNIVNHDYPMQGVECVRR